MNKNSALITIIVAVFNGAKTLQQCIDSVAQQTYLNKELIVIDGGSKDGTVNLLKKNQKHIKYWVSEPDQGIYNAWNKGLAQASGDWICFLGADDYFWDAQVLEKIAGQLALTPYEIRVAYSQVMLLGSDEASLYAVGEPWEGVKESFKHQMSIPHPGLMHRRSLFELRGEFDESFRIVGDYELLLRELKTGDAVFIPDVIVAGMRQGGISSSPENLLIALREVRRAQVMHDQNWPSIIFIMALVRVYIRLLLWKILGEKLARKALDFGRSIMGLPAYWTKT
jgi:glycosyltransferase involved in cell wall biosynthesis